MPDRNVNMRLILRVRWATGGGRLNPTTITRLAHPPLGGYGSARPLAYSHARWRGGFRRKSQYQQQAPDGCMDKLRLLQTFTDAASQRIRVAVVAAAAMLFSTAAMSGSEFEYQSAGYWSFPDGSLASGFFHADPNVVCDYIVARAGPQYFKIGLTEPVKQQVDDDHFYGRGCQFSTYADQSPRYPFIFGAVMYIRCPVSISLLGDGGYSGYDRSTDSCVCKPTYELVTEVGDIGPRLVCGKVGSVKERIKKRPMKQLCRGNPIYPLTGAKKQVVDLSLRVAKHALMLTYDTTDRLPVSVASPLATRASTAKPASIAPPGFGPLWSSSLHRRLVIESDRNRQFGARVHLGDGRTVDFTSDGSSGNFYADPDVKDRLQAISGGYRFTDAHERSQSTFDSQGQLTQVHYFDGQSLLFTYSTSNTPAGVAPASGYLVSVRDTFGRSVSFEYALPSGATPATGGKVSKVVDPAGRSMGVSYDAAGNLQRVTWQDNKVRTLIYDAPGLPWALTGILDEENVRYATFGYDASGLAVFTEHAGGTARHSVAYATPPYVAVSEKRNNALGIYERIFEWVAPSGTVLSDPLGQVSQVAVTSSMGYPLSAGQSQPAGSGCDPSTSNSTYDSGGNVGSFDDFKGNRVCYVNDTSRNLETMRVEGLPNTADCAGAFSSLPTGSRKISTFWHPTWNVRAQLFEPRKVTTFVYNGQPDPTNANAIASCAPVSATLPDGSPIAVLCRQFEQATTDANGGQGSAAALDTTVPVRMWSYTYNVNGQILTVNDPLNNTTTYAYFDSTTADARAGDLQRITNAAQHTWNFNKYDAQGQVLQSTDARGAVTTYSYDSRKRLLSVTYAGQTTSYVYDDAGLLSLVTFPDATALRLKYDAAHRLVEITDGAGNRVTYVLDNAGNRLSEQVTDSDGHLAARITRVFDALSRLQDISTALQ